MAKIKKPKEVELWWPEMVGVWFQICWDKFQDKPSFDGSSPRDLKNIVKAIRERTQRLEIEWTLDVARSRLYNFFEYAYNSSQWLRNNWLLSNINRQKDSLFFNRSKSINQQPVDPFE